MGCVSDAQIRLPSRGAGHVNSKVTAVSTSLRSEIWRNFTKVHPFHEANVEETHVHFACGKLPMLPSRTSAGEGEAVKDENHAVGQLSGITSCHSSGFSPQPHVSTRAKPSAL